MTSKANVLRAAARFGLVLDEGVSGRCEDTYTVTLDHPTDSFAGDCRSITVSMTGVPAAQVWAEVLDRILTEGPLLRPCTCPDCDYHDEED